jgi:uncharacterized protein (DUF1778 family)
LETIVATTQARPKKARPERLEVRLTADAKAIIQRAADLSNRSVSDFVVDTTLAAAKEKIREHDVFVLSARDSIAFVEALLNPSGPNEALLEAADRYREQFGS